MLGTFGHPRYELVATGDVHDGPDEVMRYFEETRMAFPDQRNELIALHHADDAVIAEFNLPGTQLGSFRGLPPPAARSHAACSRSSSSRARARESSESACISTRRPSSAGSASHTTR
jgi:hypothetical protein